MAAAPSQTVAPGAGERELPVTTGPGNPVHGRRIPLWVKLPYTAFMAVLIPYYWHAYGPANFLYFCDVAILVTLVALWAESPLLASIQAVAILVPQTLWVTDFVLKGLTGTSVLGLADYMFNPDIPLFVRCLSSFHGWLPFLLLWMTWRLGYDRRALAVQTVCCSALLLVCFFFTPPPLAPAANPHAAVNVNYVFGVGDTAQTWMHPVLWLATLMAVLPIVIYFPTHLLLRVAFRDPMSSSIPIPAVTLSRRAAVEPFAGPNSNAAARDHANFPHWRFSGDNEVARTQLSPATSRLVSCFVPACRILAGWAGAWRNNTGRFASSSWTITVTRWS